MADGVLLVMSRNWLHDMISGANRRQSVWEDATRPMTLLFTDSDTVWEVLIDSYREKTSHFSSWGFLCPGLGNGWISFSPIHFTQWTAPWFPLIQACLRNCTLYIPKEVLQLCSPSVDIFFFPQRGNSDGFFSTNVHICLISICRQRPSLASTSE